MNESTRFVLCVSNEEYPASLTVRKVYEVLPDEVGKGSGLIRIIDDSAEDYLFPGNLFVPLVVPKVAAGIFPPVRSTR